VAYRIPSLLGDKEWIIETVPEVVARLGEVHLSVEGSGPKAERRLLALADLHSLGQTGQVETEEWDYGRTVGVGAAFALQTEVS
jgi:hypothetical protein